MTPYPKHAITGVVAALIVLIVFTGGFFFGLKHASSNSVDIPGVINETADQPSETDFSPFWKAWREMNDRYVPAGTSTDTVTTREKVWGYIQGLAGSLNDPYTKFLPPSDSKVFEQNIRGDFGGVGMEIGIRDGTLTVVSPLPGTPASRAGIQAKDKIIEINGKSTQDLSVDKAVKRIRGEIGTDVELTVVRDGVSEPLSITVERAEIQIPTVRTDTHRGGVYQIKLHNFTEKSPHLFREEVESFVESGRTKLILDLRQNPGGYLGAAVEMASYFLPEGKVIVREDAGENNERNNKVFRSYGYNVVRDNVKAVVLVDGGSASASEILAGALNEHGVATLIGQQTFGKGSVQKLIPITSDPKSTLKVTVARWLTPNGTFISRNGLTPDITVERTRDDVQAGRDPQLERAIEFLNQGE
jgi:carboxyl-terminal processing protease